MGKMIAVAAQSPGHLKLMGRFERGAGDHALDVPEGAINIGGIGRGFWLKEAGNWDPTEAANHDGTLTGGLSLGDDVTVFAVPDDSGFARLMASKNATSPDGYDALNSRRLSGFHYGRVRGAENRYDSTYVPPVKLVPNSVWDALHRPFAEPYGMVELPNGFWITIYMLSPGSGSGAQMVPVSRYGEMPIKDDVYARKDFPRLLRNAGMFTPSTELFRNYAEGAPQGGENDNDTAWSSSSNTGPTETGMVEKAVSQWNVCDAAGNLHDWLSEEFDRATANGWDRAVVDTGIDSAYDRGEVNHASWRGAVGGGRFYDGARCGAECVVWDARPWPTVGYVGLRGASGPLKRDA